MNSRTIVARLLETDAAPDPGVDAAVDPKDYALTTREYKLAQLSPEIRDVLENAPDTFVDAFFDGEDTTWEVDRWEYDWWPEYDSDMDGADGWSSIAYYSEYSVEGGTLYQNIHYVDSNDSDFSEAAAVGSDTWRRMLEPYAYYRWLEANAAYSTWVAENGLDPLKYFHVFTEAVKGEKYRIGFISDGPRAKFWKARKVTGDGNSPPALDDPTLLPKEVQDYINVDANGINQDATWAEMLAMTEGTEADRPQLKRSKREPQADYIEFTFQTASSKKQAADHVKKLKVTALQAAVNERRDAKKAKTNHKKTPHYVV